MDEVRARRALQRVAYAEDWLSRLRDDLAAGHNREAMTHLITVQAELQLLSEQLAPALGWADEPALATAPAFATAPIGLPRRSPYAWASLAIACIALAMFTGMLVPQRTRTATPIQPVTETGDPVVETLASLPMIPAPILPADAAAPTADIATEPTALAAAQVATEEPAPTATRRPQQRRPTRTTPPSTTTLDPVSSEPVAIEPPVEPASAAADPAPQLAPDIALLSFRFFRSAGER